MSATSFDLAPLIERLESLADEPYRVFSADVVKPNACAMLGVRMPALRGIGRELLKGDWRAFLNASRKHPIYELRLLHAMVLGGAKCPIDEKQALIDAFLPWLDNWAVCDALCSSLKPRGDDREALFGFVCDCADSPVEFRKRFGLVMMMNTYADDAHAERVLAAYRGFRHDGYYARMGAAWGLATLFLTQRDGVLGILEDGALDIFTHNKAIQKLCESYRVSDADKRLARELRRKSGASRLKRTTLCYIERGDEYLMLHRTKKQHDDNHDKWIGIGGHIEPFETPKQCILREAKEETGLALSNCRYRGVVRFRSDAYPAEDMHLFTATQFTGEMIECDEGELAWIRKDRLLALTLWEGDRIFLKLLETDTPFFDLTLEYAGEALARAALDGREINIKETI